ncbi:hypothetical protein TNCV_4176681 [Trichonephila clavipes]|nr:hypothetical protein TNCV_4176681 [Trichonephila clavipes]
MLKLWRWRYIVSPSIVLTGNFAELIRTVSCSRSTTGVLLATCHDEFRRPRSDYVRQVGLETTTTEYFSQNRDSSEKATLGQFCTHFCPLMHQSHSLSLSTLRVYVCGALPREAEIMATVLKLYVAANVVGPNEWILEFAHSLTNGQ